MSSMIAGSPRLRAALFDVEDVIAHADAGEAERRLGARWPGLTMDAVRIARNRPDQYARWEAYSVGRLDGVAYWTEILATLGLPADAGEAAALLEIHGATAWARLDAAVLDVAARLRADGLRLGLLSNSAPYHEGRIGDFAGGFDVAHFSHRTGRRKPDPEAYRAAARDLGVPPEDIVFVDDKSRNTEAARRLGMTAIRFEGATALERALRDLRLLAAA